MLLLLVVAYVILVVLALILGLKPVASAATLHCKKTYGNSKKEIKTAVLYYYLLPTMYILYQFDDYP
jgi:hypothetical protein